MNQHRIHQIFFGSVLLKGGHDGVDCVAGIVLTLVSTSKIVDIVNTLTQEELIEDQNDFVATHLLVWAQNFSMGTKNFYAFYLLSHGVVKLLLVIGLLRNKLWSYPASLVVLG